MTAKYHRIYFTHPSNPTVPLPSRGLRLKGESLLRELLLEVLLHHLDVAIALRLVPRAPQGAGGGKRGGSPSA